MWKPQKIYADFLLDQPVILFGERSVFGLTSFPGAKVAVIYGNSFGMDGKQQIQKVFSKRAVHFIPRSWKSEPDLDSLGPVVRALEAFAPDVILAVGGGAVLDGAKLCRVLYEFPSFRYGETRLDQLTFKTKLIAVPTTIGSGAEASSAAVFIDHTQHRKEMVVSHGLRPDVVILDPFFVSAAPYQLLAVSGMDAAAHILEGYVSKVNNALTDILAEQALRILIEGLSQTNITTVNFLRLQYAGYLGGIIQNHCLVGAAHGIAHQVPDFGYSHAEAVALLLPAVIRQNQKDEQTFSRYQMLSSATGLGGITDVIAFLEQLHERIGLSVRKDKLRQLLLQQVGRDEFVSNVNRDSGGSGNPVPVDENYLKQLLGDF